jgi:hypothetical protein
MLRSMRAPFIASTALSLVLLGMVANGFGATTRVPALRVAGQTVQGRQFHKREIVRVTFVFESRQVRRVRSSATGSFGVLLPAAYDPCNGSLTITALGALGDQARLKLPQRACLPQ